MKQLISRSILSICLILGSAVVAGPLTHRGGDFWVVFPSQSGAISALEVVVTAYENATGSISAPSNPALDLDFDLTPGQRVTRIFPLSFMQTSDAPIDNIGIHIFSSGQVEVEVRSRGNGDSGSYLALPVDVFGGRYTVVSPSSFANQRVSLSLTSPFDNSVVTVTLPGQTPQTFTLNRGQTYLYRDFAGTLDGTTVVSSFPVGVIVSSDNTSGNSFSATQLIPEPLLGNQFAIPAPPAFLDGYLKACAVRDNTTITVDGVTQTTLNRGEVYSAFHTSGLFLEGSQNLVVLSYLVEVEGSAASTELVPAVDEGVDFVRLNTSGPGRVDSVQVVVPANERTLLRAGGQPVPESRFTLFGNGAYAQANFLLGNPINLNTSGASGLAARVVGEGPGGPTLTTSSARFRDFFTVTQLDSPVYGQPVRFRVSAPANFDPLFRFICYRPVGTLPYVIDNLVLQNGEYFGTIPGQYINEKGVEFHISFSDGTVLRTSPGVNAERDPAVISVPLANFQPPSLDIEAAVYKMISIPYPLDSPSVNSVIEDDYGPYDPAVWRVFRYLPSLGDYRELPDLVEGAEDFRRGRAFWLVANLDNIFDVDGTRTLSAVDSARVTLESGWNQLGNPFAFQVRWDSIPGADALQGPYYYDGVEYVIDNRLRPWEGVFVFNPGAAFDLVIPPYDALQGLGKSPQNGVDEVAWALRLQASIAGTRYRDTQTRLGWVEDGQPDPATLALREPPPVSSNLQVMILEEETSYLQYFKSFTEAGMRWRLRVASPGANQTVTLQFLEEAALREGFELACYDAKTGKSLPIRQGVLQLSTGASGERFLELAVGSADFQTQTAADLQPVITRFALQPNYPNPFNPETEIRFDLPRAGEVKLSVFNLLGQEIRTLSTGNYDAGSHSVRWDGRDQQGDPVASGIYLYRIQSQGWSAVRKMILVR